MAWMGVSRGLPFGGACAAALALLLSMGTAAAGPPAATAPGGRRLVSIEDMARVRHVRSPRISPDGAWVAYTVTTPDPAADRERSDLWMTSWDGATTLRLTATDDESEESPRFSPDGRTLAFLSSRGDEEEADQLWLLPRAGGEAERITMLRAGVSDFAWSPDGTRLVLAVADTDSVARKDEAGKDRTPPPIVIDRLYFKEDGAGYLTHLRTHLYLLDLASRKVERLTAGDHDDVMPVWSPDGKSIAFLSKRGPDADRTNSWEIFVCEARSGGATRQLTRYEGAVNNPGGEDGENRIAWSPDGDRIAFVQGGPESLIYYAVNRLAVVPAAGGPVRVLTADLDRWVKDFTWTTDGTSLTVLLEEDRAQHLVRIPAVGGRPEPVLAGRGSVWAFDASPGGRIAALVSTTTAFLEVYAVDGPGMRPLSRQNDALLAGLRLAPVEEISFPSRDGTEIHGFMVLPPDHREGVRHPAILRVHGGPVGQFDAQVDEPWELCWQVLAARGYVVLAANPRGSSGRGQAFCSAIYADWGNKDAEDVLAAVDYVVARGIADPERLGIGGWSYGGILTNAVIARDARFKAAISGASMSNLLAGYGTDMYIREWEAEIGPPWNATETYLRLSFPFLHADRIVTPTLFLCGQDDFNVPLLNSEQMYQALRSLGRDTQLVIYPGQHHGFDRPSYDLDRLKRSVAWYDRYLGSDVVAPRGAPGGPGE